MTPVRDFRVPWAAQSLARHSSAVSLLLGLSLLARPGLADPSHPSALDLAAARQLGTAGAVLAEQGRCKEALDKLERAAALYAAPTIVGRLGECRVKLGQIVKGTEELERVVHQKLGPDAPKPFIEAQERARHVLAQALPRIAQLTIVVRAPKGVAPHVTVDGHPVPLALIGAARPTDPGNRVVEARARGCRTATTRVHLRPGARKAVHLVLAFKNGRGVSADFGQPTSFQRTTAYVLFGVSGAGIVTGSVLGILAWRKRAVLSDNCPNNRCSAAYQNDIDSARALGTGATIAFGVGLAAAAAGTYFLFTSPTTEPATGVHARAWIGPGSLGLAGWF